MVLLCVVYQNNHKDFAHLLVYVLFTCLRCELSNGRGKITGRNFEQRSPNGTVILKVVLDWGFAHPLNIKGFRSNLAGN